MTTYNKQLPNFYTNEQVEKSDREIQIISDADNQLWPSHKSIPEDVKEELQWYYDLNDIDYTTEESRIESTLQSPHVKLHELAGDLNDTISHIFQKATNDSTFAVRLGSGIGLSILLLILIALIVVICREWLRRNSRSENDANRNSYNWGFCFHCGLGGKTTMKKMAGISIGRSRNHYKDEDDV
uniref:Uncharacterized protein n=1 Tax=Elaeophora elaphi TaxID=1147741 RepID=A0A0R3RKT3_9BILA